jgi:thioredoxin reductase (NADPH)
MLNGGRFHPPIWQCMAHGHALIVSGRATYMTLKDQGRTTMAEFHETLVIIGSGPAGYTAAIYAARAMLKPVIIAGMEQGGQLMITTDVENYPGYAAPVMGPWLMDQMRQQAEHVGTRMVNDLVTRVDLSRRPFRLELDGGDVYVAQSVIICTGAKARWLGIPSEDVFKGYGVSACATCDGFFYRGKDVVVVGGGNSAVEEALYLSNLARKVTVVHRRDTFRAERILQERLFAKPNVTVIWDHAVDEVLGHRADGTRPAAVTGVRLRNVKTGVTQEISTDGFFVAIGHAPATELFQGQLEMKANGYLVTAPDSTATAIPGVYAAGDVTDDIYRQAVTAAGMGCMAALEAEKFLAAQETPAHRAAGAAAKVAAE